MHPTHEMTWAGILGVFALIGVIWGMTRPGALRWMQRNYLWLMLPLVVLLLGGGLVGVKQVRENESQVEAPQILEISSHTPAPFAVESGPDHPAFSEDLPAAVPAQFQHRGRVLLFPVVLTLGLAIAVVTILGVTGWLMGRGYIMAAAWAGAFVIGGIGVTSFVALSAWQQTPPAPQASAVAISSQGSVTRLIASETRRTVSVDDDLDSVSTPTLIESYEFNGSHFSATTVDEVPAWVNESQPSVRNGERIILTLHSQRFATLAEAENELYPQLTSEVLRDLQETHPEISNWSPTPNQAFRAGILKRRVVEEFPLQVGEHKEHVIRVHWQAELDPTTRTSLVQVWRPEQLQGRLMGLSGTIGGLALLFGGIALVLNPPRRSKPTPA